ncbi:MAG: ABC transporter ATP-binding protein [Roseitalea sp.]|nr:ABC transporter ATP-binding protein [Roseitalea sp.]MBO6953696.1 ABC transporter ATP-binding protein [Rhizobiaceae bacterium]MBO6594045.1 ABC transporter ATP-binding protein [Roseitalea sp.]MBO6601522.1 ABC transporter ATP-binding protein [Roseitalea sp.]MBO6613612.1 ABC transporter ATP-binding protein [Roseitalea sp.]
MIQLEGVTVRKGDTLILDAISVTLTERRIGIIGANGSGKSTFARLLNGLERPTTGTVRVDGQPTDRKSPLGKVGFVFQNPDNQIVMPLVDEDLAFGLRKSGLSKFEIGARVRSHLDRFGLTHLSERRTHELSGGEKQLIALIGVLVMEPAIIVLDEPTTLLDLRNRRILVSFLERLDQTLIVVSHDLELMASMDRLIWIDERRIRGDGDAGDIVRAYREAIATEPC